MDTAPASEPEAPVTLAPTILSLVSADRLRELGYDPDRGYNQAVTVRFTRTGDNQGTSSIFPDPGNGRWGGANFRHWSMQSLEVGQEHAITIFNDGKIEYTIDGVEAEQSVAAKIFVRDGHEVFRRFAKWLSDLAGYMPAVTFFEGNVRELVRLSVYEAFFRGDIAAIAAGPSGCRFLSAEEIMERAVSGEDEVVDPAKLMIHSQWSRQDPFYAIMGHVVVEAVRSLVPAAHKAAIEDLRQKTRRFELDLDAEIARRAAPPETAEAPPSDEANV